MANVIFRPKGEQTDIELTSEGIAPRRAVAENWGARHRAP